VPRARILWHVASRHACTVQLFPALSDAYPVHYPAALCTWEVFLWLRCLFDSRAFHLKAVDGSLMPSLLPGADMFNYRFPLLSLRLSHPRPSPSFVRIFLSAAFGPTLCAPRPSGRRTRALAAELNSLRLRDAAPANKCFTCTAAT
jgi:hypothetical protein